MNISTLKSFFHEELSGMYPDSEIESFYHILTEFKLKMSRIDKALNPTKSITEQEKTYFTRAIELLKKETPVQYITKETEFYSLPFEVNENVLIPRPETEELVDWIIQSSNKSTPLKILDIGTGSGCIAISLAKNLPSAQVIAIDVSELALMVAEKNAKHNHVTIKFTKQDILSTEKFIENFDIIVSNPPYVRELEKEEIKKNVLEYEPHTALFVDDNNALVFYKKIADLAFTHLTENGKLFFEINQYLGQQTLDMLREKGFKKNKLKKDIFGNDRMILSQK
ncbi:peptide chain release factor N(5)-glutamine methyltransferase [Flavicella marina]|uniref:peptide chain release factor N(5)-glutamine methyltransferase n=1 Tax=Flavicella marina TaxID=1475951 RepID=UPI001265A93D|nr:peptide chain release factor N(5)-glutamine methyltransferase [Flavicella marina]